MTKTIIFTIFLFTLFTTFSSFGQKRPCKFNTLTTEIGLSATYNSSNKLRSKLTELLLFKNKIDLTNPPKTGCLYGVGMSISYIKTNNFYISSVFEYFNGFFEIDGKMNVLLRNGFHYIYYFEPQIGIYFKKASSVVSIGYNIPLNRRNPAQDVGITLSYIYKHRPN